MLALACYHSGEVTDTSPAPVVIGTVLVLADGWQEWLEGSVPHPAPAEFGGCWEIDKGAGNGSESRSTPLSNVLVSGKSELPLTMAL